MSSSKPAALSLNPKPQDHKNAPKEDLWAKALSTLSEEDRKQYVDTSSSPREVLQKVHEATENTKEACVKKGWRVYRKKNGDEVKLRHVLEKLSKWVEMAIKVTDVGVSFDQSGHSALPWGIVKFIVTVLGKSNIDVFSDVVEGVESVSSLITRYTVVENLYLHGSNEAAIRLRQSITEFYATILTYLGRIKKFFSGSSIKRIGRSLIEVARKQYDKTKISETEVQHWMRLVDADVNRETSKREIEHRANLAGMMLELNKPIIRMNSQLDILQDHLNSEERRQVFRWMSEIEYRSHHEDLSKGLLPNSGQWLLDHELFIEWGQSNVSSILWLHGIPGSGKTRLVSRIIDVMADEGQAGQSPTAFFYCARSTAEPERGQPAEILGAILRQLCSSKPDMPIKGPVAKEYKTRRQKADDDCSRVRKLSVEDCTRLITELTKDNPATIIIDALDECDEDTRHELLEALEMLVGESTELVRVLVSSRDDVDITLRLDSCKNVSISADCNARDIERFVVSEVDRLISKKLLLDGHINKRLRDKLINTLTSRAQGMFRWVAMSLETLQEIKFRPDFEKALGQLPSKLSGLYDIVHSQIEETESYGRDTAIKALKWLLCAQRLLSAKELIAAIDNSRGKSDGTDSTSDSDEGFIGGNSDRDHIEGEAIAIDSLKDLFNKSIDLNFIVESSDGDLFENDSLKDISSESSDDERISIEIIESSSSSILSWSRSDEIRKNDILRSCRNLVTIDAQLQHFRFAHQSVREYLLNREEYTTEAQHTLAAERCLDVHLTEAWPDLVNSKFLRRNDHLKRYSSFYWPVHYKYVENTGSQDLLQKMSTFMTQGSRTSPAYLQWASDFASNSRDLKFFKLEQYLEHEHSKKVLDRRLLLASSEPKTYLSAVCAFGLSNLMKDRELSIEDCSHKRYPLENFWREPAPDSLLSIASQEGHDQIVEMLLAKGADVTAQTGVSSALYWASAEGHGQIVEMLLAKGADSNAQIGYTSALQKASAAGHESVVKILLINGAHVDHEGRNRDTALRLASKSGHVSVARLLIENGADVRLEIYRKNDNPIGDAAKNGHDAVVQMLLCHDFDVNQFIGTALQKASAYGHNSIMQRLLDLGADVNAQDEYGRSPIHDAYSRGHESSIQILLDHGADVNIRDCTGGSALHRASSPGHKFSMEMLLDHGADINARNIYGESALHKAAWHGKDDLVSILLNHGADVNAQNEVGASPLHCASRSDFNETIKILLDHGADVNAQDRAGESALHYACRYNFDELVEILLDHGADVNAQNRDGESALHHASRLGSCAIMTILLDHGADIDKQTNDGEGALHYASRFEGFGFYKQPGQPKEKVLRLLLSHGADVHVRNKKGESAMDWARKPPLDCRWDTTSERRVIAQLLLDHGAIDTSPKPENESGRVQEVVSEDLGTGEHGIED
ncbi:MAG: hypothetical protein Q9195_004625 [Heterodermia aff. obscurata]